MTSHLRLSVLGSVLDIEVDDAALPRLTQQWGRCLAAENAEADDNLPLTTYPDTEDGRHRHDYSLTSAVTLRGITRASGTRTMLHAAGISDDRGAVAVLIAASGTGKTTAARTLAQRFGYVSDETISIGDHGDVLPYPKPLSVVLQASDPYHKSQHSPDELGLRTAAADLHAQLFVLLNRVTEATEPRLEPVDLIDAMVAVIPQTSALPSQPRPFQTLAGHLMSGGGVWRLTYQEIADTSPLIEEALRNARAPEVDIEVFGQVEEKTPPAHSWVRAPYLDAIGVDDEILVLVGTMPIRLGGVGTTVWRAAHEPRTLEQLIAACVTAHGDHPDAAALVSATVDQLTEHGALVAGGA